MLRASILVPISCSASQVWQSASDLSARPTSIRLRSRTALAAHVPSASCRGASVVPHLQRQLRSRCPTLSVSWQDSPGGFARPRSSVFHCTAAVLVGFGLTSQSRGTYIVRCTTHVPLFPALDHSETISPSTASSRLHEYRRHQFPFAGGCIDNSRGDAPCPCWRLRSR